MRPELPIISFISSIILLLIVPLFALRKLKTNIPTCILLFWLVIVHLIHGVNSAIWFNTTGLPISASTSIWCDIVTKALLGALFAVPTNCIFIARHTLTSSNPISSTSHYNELQTRYNRSRRVLDIAPGIIIPIVFMCLHPIVQDYRFTIVKDLGCLPSIYPSVTALVIFWLPLVVLCAGTIIYSGILFFRIWRSSRRTQKLDAYIQLCFVIFATAMICFVGIVHMLSSKPQDSISWRSVHEYLSDFLVFQKPDWAVEATWWSMFVITLAFLGLCVLPQLIPKQNLKLKVNMKGLRVGGILPLYRTPRSPNTIREYVCEHDRRSSLSIPRPAPIHVQLKSGWDSMLDSEPTRRIPPSPTAMSNKHRIRSMLSTMSLNRKGSPTPSVKSRGSTEEGGVFSEAAMSYLVSRSLGLGSAPTTPNSPPPPSTPSMYSVRTPPPSPITPPEPVYTPLPPSSPTPCSLPSFVPSITPPDITLMRPSIDTHSSTTMTLTSTLIPTPDVPEDARSTLSAILTHDWPLPPPSTPSTPTAPPSPRSPPSPSPSFSPSALHPDPTSYLRMGHVSTSSTDTYGFAVYPTQLDTRPSSPFQGSAVPIQLAEIRPLEIGNHLRVNGSGKLRKKRSQPAHAGVMMSVVQETQAC